MVSIAHSVGPSFDAPTLPTQIYDFIGVDVSGKFSDIR